MKSLCKIISLLAVFMILFTSISFADNTQYADLLFELGLFKGTTEGYDLGSPFTREQAATMLVRLSGAEEEALASKYEQQFDDVRQDRWSFKYVMYCYENEITKGVSTYFFNPDREISASEFLTLVLRMLGYSEAEPESARNLSVHKFLLSSEQADAILNADTFLRDDMVFVAYRCLKTKTSDGEVFADVLAEKGVITQSQADEFDVYGAETDIDTFIESLLK